MQWVMCMTVGMWYVAGFRLLFDCRPSRSAPYEPEARYRQRDLNIRRSNSVRLIITLSLKIRNRSVRP